MSKAVNLQWSITWGCVCVERLVFKLDCKLSGAETLRGEAGCSSYSTQHKRASKLREPSGHQSNTNNYAYCHHFSNLLYWLESRGCHVTLIIKCFINHQSKRTHTTYVACWQAGELWLPQGCSNLHSLLLMYCIFLQLHET